MNEYRWTSGSGRLTLDLTAADVARGYHSGACDDDIAELLVDPRIALQVAEWDAQTLVAELREYGAWDAAELTDVAQNRARMLWLACSDVFDSPEIYAVG